MRRALAWLGLGFLLVSAGFLIRDFILFQWLGLSCGSIANPPNAAPPGDALYCDWYHVACHARPTGCGERAGYLAAYKFYLWDIVPLDWRQASVLGYLWTLFEYAAAFAWDGALFVWFVVQQPFIVNPPIWVALAWFFGGNFSIQPASGPLDVLERQKALGDATKATPIAAHRALIGASVHADERFKD